MSELSSLSQPLLITGGTGFAGSHLVEALLERGYTNLHVTHFGSHQPELPSTVQIHQLNLSDRDATFALFSAVKPAVIYHLASFAAVSSSFDQAEAVLQNNIGLQLTVLEATRQFAPTARLLVVGSAEEYGMVKLADNETVDELFPLNPANPYAVSKTAQDLLAQSYFLSYGLDIVRARPFNHIGERQTPAFAVPAFAKQIVAIERGEQEALQVGNVSAVRDFTDVKDMVRAYIALAERGSAGEVYNLGSGQGHTMQAVLDQLCSLSTTAIKVVTDPSRIRPLDLPRLVANNAKARSLGWSPTIPLHQTLERILKYWREQS